MTVGVVSQQRVDDFGNSLTNEEEQRFDSLLEMALQHNTVEEFKTIMYHMQAVRRRIVASILASEPVQREWVDLLRHTYNVLNDNNTNNFQREMIATTGNFSVNVKDEIIGLQKDLQYLESLLRLQSQGIKVALNQVDLLSILRPYHPLSPDQFKEECNNCLAFLKRFVVPVPDSNGTLVKPIMITDWDGTMKDYCSQYATNLQPIYSALGLHRFAQDWTRLTAVLTAGPLRGPGILDLTALPIDGNVVFSGSWGREWWLHGKRVVHDDGIPSEGRDALERVNDEMKTLLTSGEYSQFGLVGSGVQRKVDRLTLGVQTVCRHVQPELSNRYQDEIKERMCRVDPEHRTLHFDPSTELEVEIVVHNDGTVWNKANGVERLIKTVDESLSTGRVLICGDTSSDLPM
ncbi:unnamed protein product [Bursaphelenchus okinawaensis]|uniref:T6PP_N domain-containing protein n=1 Tax=Bursaphelenchus okinawaensis TaxID=465554 RepID=A0A811LP93_9BILA|nr:unnamed protein product [Bursaphelenchus okinawaensis]CAG9127516.1 unnamed protein product [Bursaphelenchus okinawaensis]